MTRRVLEKIARDMKIDLKQFDFVKGEYTNSRESFIEIQFWKDQGIGTDRTKHDVRKKRYSVAALSKAWQSGGDDWGDYLTKGATRIFNIR